MKQIKDRKLFNILIIAGFFIILLGIVINFVVGAMNQGDFSFVGAIVAGSGVLLLVITIIYTLLKIITKKLLKIINK